MSLTKSLSTVLKILIASCGFLATFSTMIDLMYFLSDPYSTHRSYNTKKEGIWISGSRDLLWNMFLLSLFILQHTLLATFQIKSIASKYGLNNVYRSLYVCLTSVTLQVLIRNWQSIPDVLIWHFNFNSRPFWWIYLSIHIFSWFVIYVGCICLDVNELLGIKQVYYSIINFPDPNSRKSNQLQRLNSHMRHPSFLAFLLIFWTVPVMSLDRLLLSAITSLYMYFAWNTDQADYVYQKSQYIKKFHELEQLRN